MANNFVAYCIVPGNSERCIQTQIYGIGNNGFHPNNSMDELVMVGDQEVNERTGRDWGWSEEDGLRFEGSLEEAIALSKTLPNNTSNSSFRKEELEAYCKKIASNSNELKSQLSYCSESGLYSFRFHGTFASLRMRIETRRVTAFLGSRPKMFWTSFEW